MDEQDGQDGAKPGGHSSSCASCSSLLRFDPPSFVAAWLPCERMPSMLLRIDFRSGRPGYLQIVDQIKAAAASGTLRPGEALPSIGSLAEELRLNRNAVTKAYSELERLEAIEMRPGLGYFLKENREPSRKDVRRKPLTAEIGQAIEQVPHVLKTTLLY